MADDEIGLPEALMQAEHWPLLSPLAKGCALCVLWGVVLFLVLVSGLIARFAMWALF